jgi:hypothetical protein
MRSIGTGILGKSVAAGKFIIPDPTSFAIAVVYQALAPQIGIYEHSFQTTDIIVSTLSERFDSGKLKVSFNEDEYKASRNLSVAFRDEKLYADTSLSYFARVISSNAMTDDQKDQYSKFLDTYRKYLLNSALRGIEDSDKDQSLTDSINSFIPKPKSEPEPTSKVYD